MTYRNNSENKGYGLADKLIDLKLDLKLIVRSATCDTYLRSLSQTDQK